MKKVLLILMLILCTLFLFACGGGQSTTTEEDTTPADEGAATDESTEAPEPVVIKIGSVGPESGDLIADGVQHFKTYVEENSDGAITVELYANGVLGGDTDMSEQLSTGTLEMALPSFASLSMYDERIGIPDMNFLFSSKETATKAMNGELGAFIKGLLEEKNITFVGPVVCTESNCLLNNVRPIVTPDDLAGLKIRTQQSNPHVAAFNMLGANATPMSFTELFTAMQNGTVDGCENNPSLASGMGFAEVSKYGTDLQQVQSCSTIFICKAWYDGLDPAIRQIVDDGLKAAAEWQTGNVIPYEEAAFQTMADEGMEVTYLTDEQRAAFREKALPYMDEYIDKWGQEIFDLAWEYENQ